MSASCMHCQGQSWRLIISGVHAIERTVTNQRSLIMCTSIEELRNQADWDGADGQSRKFLLSELSSTNFMALLSHFIND